MEKNSVLIAIPALNEEETIGKVIEDVRREYPAFHVLVINDGSQDQTSLIARNAGAKILEMPFNVGVGGAMRAAFQYGLENQVDFIIQLDGDGQHDSQSIQNLIECAHFSDVVVGSRFNSMSKMEIGFVRNFAISFLKLLVRKATKTQISDPTSGFRLANRRAMEIFVDAYPTSYLGDTVGSLILAGQKGLRINEVDVIMHERKGGRASQNWIKLPLHLLRVTLVGLLFLVKKKSFKKEVIK